MKSTFLWGSATASYQCEGAWNLDDKIESIWDVYLHENNFENGDISSDHYHHFEEDIKMMKEGGQNSYRFSLSWCRILNQDNQINPKGIDFYNKIINCCIANDITPFVTIYHWDLPNYLQEKGGWLHSNTCYAFLEFSKVCFAYFGDRIRYWTTFNEPRWFVFNGYFIGNYPPCHQNIEETIKAAFHVMFASALVVQEFKQKNYPGNIGIVHSYSPVDGIDQTLATKIAMRYADNYCNNWILDTAVFGEIPIDLLTELSKKYDISYMKEEYLKIIKNNTVDFLGLNYYSRVLVKPYTSGETSLIVNNSGKKAKGTSKVIIKGWFEQVADPNSKYTEWDTEIYPKGLQDGLVKAYQKYQIPLYVTENGIGYYEDVSNGIVNDVYRISYMNDHLLALINAIDLGADVRGYFTWSSFDLYSWKNGCEKRYGLVAVDFDNQQIRSPKASYHWYKSVILSNGKNIK